MSLSHDLRAATRQLARKPLADGAAAATLALGIGSSVALFSLVDAVLLRPLPYSDADRLVAVWDSTPEAGDPRSRVSGFEYLRWREEARTLDALALVGTTSGALTGKGEPIEVEGFRVTCNTFALLGVKAHAGRTLTEDDCEQTAPPVTVISDALWRRKLGADPKGHHQEEEGQDRFVGELEGTQVSAWTSTWRPSAKRRLLARSRTPSR